MSLSRQCNANIVRIILTNKFFGLKIKNILKSISIKIGENIKRLRTDKGLTQAQLAELLEVPGERKNRVVSSWENNVARPSYEYCVRMTNIFGVTLEELMLELSVDTPTDAPQIADPVERTAVVAQLRELEQKVLGLANELAEDREDREILLKKLAEYEQIISDLRRNYPSPPSE